MRAYRLFFQWPYYSSKKTIGNVGIIIKLSPQHQYGLDNHIVKICLQKYWYHHHKHIYTTTTEAPRLAESHSPIKDLDFALLFVLVGFTEWEDESILAAVLAESQKEYLEKLKMGAAKDKCGYEDSKS